MNIGIIILLLLLISVLLYFFTVRLDEKIGKLSGPLAVIAVIVLLLGSVSYYLFWNKSIYILVTSGDSVLQKRSVEFDKKVWDKEDEFVYVSETRGVHKLDFSQQVRDFLELDEEKQCRDYSSHDIGSGRYKKEASIITVCVSKKGIRWYF